MQPRMTAVKQVHLVQRKAQWGEAWPRHSRSEGATEGASDEKVETNDWTTKFGLSCIWLAAPAIEAKTCGKPMPETAKADAWDCKLDKNVTGIPPDMLELASTLVGV